MLFFSAELGHLDQNRSGVTGILGLQASRQLIALIGLLGDNRGQNRSHPSGLKHTVQYKLSGHLVRVHGQQGFVDLNCLQLFSGQLVLNTLSIGQFHLFLGVKHVLVLEVQRAQIKTLVTNMTDTIRSSGRKFLYFLPC